MDLICTYRFSFPGNSQAHISLEVKFAMLKNYLKVSIFLLI